MPRNADDATVEGFGQEWKAFDYADHSEAELAEIFESYFAVFPWDGLPPDAHGFDAGCGTGRWARLVAPRVGRLECIDASGDALDVARRNLADLPNCTFHLSSIQEMPIADGSMDFGYSLGVLHHVPDTLDGLKACVRKLKPGAPFLLYLYYALDNRPRWFRALWRATDVARAVVSTLPFRARRFTTDAIATLVYYPLARTSRALETLGAGVERIPLSAYRHRSFYVMRTDALDRFGTRLEQRFTRSEIETMMRAAGLERIRFAEQVPYWTAVGYRASSVTPRFSED